MPFVHVARGRCNYDGYVGAAPVALIVLASPSVIAERFNLPRDGRAPLLRGLVGRGRHFWIFFGLCGDCDHRKTDGRYEQRDCASGALLC